MTLAVAFPARWTWIARWEQMSGRWTAVGSSSLEGAEPLPFAPSVGPWTSREVAGLRGAVLPATDPQSLPEVQSAVRIGLEGFRTKPAQRPFWKASVLRWAEAGQRLDPDNAFYPTAKAVVATDFDVPLREASQSARFDDGVAPTAQRLIEVDEEERGYRGELRRRQLLEGPMLSQYGAFVDLGRKVKAKSRQDSERDLQRMARLVYEGTESAIGFSAALGAVKQAVPPSRQEPWVGEVLTPLARKVAVGRNEGRPDLDARVLPRRLAAAGMFAVTALVFLGVAAGLCRVLPGLQQGWLGAALALVAPAIAGHAAPLATSLVLVGLCFFCLAARKDRSASPFLALGALFGLGGAVLQPPLGAVLLLVGAIVALQQSDRPWLGVMTGPAIVVAVAVPAYAWVAARLGIGNLTLATIGASLAVVALRLLLVPGKSGLALATAGLVASISFAGVTALELDANSKLAAQNHQLQVQADVLREQTRQQQRAGSHSNQP